MTKNKAFACAILVTGALWVANSWPAVRFGTSLRTNPHYVLPALAAVENGLWSESGIELKWVPFVSGTTMIRAIAAGEVDTGTIGLNSIILSVSRGVPIIAVADPGVATIFSFWVRGDSRLRKPEDLKGARIGVTGFGSEAHAYAVAAVRALGLEKDVKFVSMGGAGPQIAGLRSGATDVTNLSFVTMAALAVKGEVRQLLKVPEYLPAEFAHLQMTFVVIDFFHKQVEAVRKAHRGFVKGEEFVTKNQAWALEKLKAEFRYTDAVAQAVYPMLLYNPKPRIDRRNVEGAIRFLVEFDLLKKDKVPSLEKIYVEGFAP